MYAAPVQNAPEKEASTTSRICFAAEINATNNVYSEEAVLTTSNDAYATDINRIDNVYNEVEARMQNVDYKIEDIVGSQSNITNAKTAHLSCSIQWQCNWFFYV